jgi:hypothetical protein
MRIHHDVCNMIAYSLYGGLSAVAWTGIFSVRWFGFLVYPVSDGASNVKREDGL